MSELVIENKRDQPVQFFREGIDDAGLERALEELEQAFAETGLDLKKYVKEGLADFIVANLKRNFDYEITLPAILTGSFYIFLEASHMASGDFVQIPLTDTVLNGKNDFLLKSGLAIHFLVRAVKFLAHAIAKHRTQTA